MRGSPTAAQEQEVIAGSAAGVAWSRLRSLIRPSRGALAAMLAASAAASAAGIVPALMLSPIVDGLSGSGRATIDLGPAAAIVAAALVVEAAALTTADTLYSRIAGRLSHDLRLAMYAGAAGRGDGISSRFVSDAEAPAELMVGAVDLAFGGALQVLAALAALAVADVRAAVATLAIALAVAVSGRQMQRPVADAAEARQAALEAMSHALARRREGRAFRRAVVDVFGLDARLGWLEARATHIPGFLTAAGPFAALLIATTGGIHRPGPLIAIFALAGRLFRGAEDLLDVGLDLELVRGAIRRCFELL